MTGTVCRRLAPGAHLARVAGMLLLGLGLSAQCRAGAYIFAGEVNGLDLVTHPNTYSGTGGIVSVRVCINPASPDASAMEIPVQNNITIFNRLQPTTGNLFRGSANNVPASQIDFESVALHELGHCLGLAHVNAASESGQTGNNENYTKATDGANNVLDLNPGPDGVIGSQDDLRGDDVNLHWYRRANNNPFTIDEPVDSSTYTRSLTALQSLGHSFAANADRAVAQLLGVPNTEAVMQQGTFFDEAQRTLAHDDVATLRYAASGLDEVAGNGDDYQIRLEYGGISTSNCDISLSVTATPNLAFCEVNGVFIGPNHVRITTASIEFDEGAAWYFNTDTVNQPPVLNPIGDRSIGEGQIQAIGLAATDPDADALQFSAAGLPAFAALTDHGDGTASLDLAPAVGSAGSYPVTIDAIDAGLPALSDGETFNIVVGESDADGDGLGDSFETSVLGTNPNAVDSDDDGLADGSDGVVLLAALPDGIDADGDGFVDGEQDLGTDPTLADTDGDRLPDGLEVANGSDPQNPASWPALADGDLAPLGSPDGLINAADYLIGQRIVLGLLTATPLELAHGDLHPVVAADGDIDMSDLILLLQRVQNAP
jgi:hypothetical protein